MVDPRFDPNRVRPGERVVVVDGLTLIQSVRSAGKPESVHQAMLAALALAHHRSVVRLARRTTARHQRRAAAQRHAR